MRDISITKHRKILEGLQKFCSMKKEQAKLKDCNTDFTRGIVDGEHMAYNEVLRELHSLIQYAENNWLYDKNISPREERNK